MRAIRSSWPALVLLVLVYLGADLLARTDLYKELANDPKGSGPAFLYWPVACFAVCLVEAYRHGGSPVRGVTAAALVAVPLILLDHQDVAGAMPLVIVYTPLALAGEGIGTLLRRAASRRAVRV